MPITEYPEILLAHGGGGKLSKRLIDSVFLPAFKNKFLNQHHDGAVVKLPKNKIAFTTDSYVVHPLFFPGGDIGSMAVYGTVNDLAMCGARALYLSAGFILEEGLKTEVLTRVVASMKQAARRCGVSIITGDTKVVERGKADGIFINTAGVGVVKAKNEISPAAVQNGDVILLSGDLGRHGMAIMAVREGLSFQSQITSDSAPVFRPVMQLIKSGISIHCLRDLTRGGLASALNEIATARRCTIRIDEASIAVRQDVRGSCEILGLDPLYVANEGRFVAFVPAKQSAKALKILRSSPVCSGASAIGQVYPVGSSPVTVKNAIGTSRVLDMITGQQLPRIC